MDLSSFDSRKGGEDGAALQLRHPLTDEPLTDEKTKAPVTITLAGADSETFRRAAQSQGDKRIKSNTRRQFTMAAAYDDAIDLLAACTLGWSNIELDGKPLAFSQDNAKVLYDRLPWLREQVNSFIGDRANFLKA